MRQLRLLSALLTVAGLAVVAAAVAGLLDATLLLVGLLLLLAGAVKVVVVALWRHLDADGAAPAACWVTQAAKRRRFWR